MILSDSKRCRYRVDAGDVLAWVDDWFLAFARENGASELTWAEVLGRSLWEFIDDTATRDLYKHIHSRVRATGRQVVLPFRCDSPTLRRHMLLRITLVDSGDLMYEGVLTRAEPTAVLNVLDPAFPRSRAKLTLCSCCKRALVETSGWLKVEDAVARLGLFEKPKAPRLNYTVCHECSEVFAAAPESGNLR